MNNGSSQSTGVVRLSAEALKKSLIGKYLAFSLANGRYGVGILKVIELIGMMHITKIPRCAEYVRGVINLRGKIIPVIDLRMKFGLHAAEYDEKTCIIVVNGTIGEHNIAIGMIVDTVLEALHFDEAHIEPAPEYGVGIDASYVRGLGKAPDDGVVIFIDIDHAINVPELTGYLNGSGSEHADAH
jgi:purine-binding chemotaxis protein CheW